MQPKEEKPPPSPPVERRPDPAEGGERGPVDAEPVRAPDVEARIREIEDALWREIESMEARLRVIKEQFRALTGEPLPATPAPRVPKPPSGEVDEGDEKRYKALLKRQEELVERWRTRQNVEAKRPADDSPPGAPPGGARPRPPAEGAGERIRGQLRDVLSEVLDLRERARERQVRRLQAELEEIERAMSLRRREEERRALIESRLEELLGGAREKQR